MERVCCMALMSTIATTNDWLPAHTRFSSHLYVAIIMLMFHAFDTYLMISCISYRLYADCTEITH
jgi:hypothetical protein